MNAKKLLNKKIKKEDGWEKFGPEGIERLLATAIVVNLVLSCIAFFGMTLEVPYMRVLFYILFGTLIILVAPFIVKDVMLLINTLRLKSKIRKLPLTDLEIMLNFGKVDSKELTEIEATKLYVEYLKALKGHEAFSTIGDESKEIVRSELKKYMEGKDE